MGTDDDPLAEPTVVLDDEGDYEASVTDYIWGFNQTAKSKETGTGMEEETWSTPISTDFSLDRPTTGRNLPTVIDDKEY